MIQWNVNGVSIKAIVWRLDTARVPKENIRQILADIVWFTDLVFHNINVVEFSRKKIILTDTVNTYTFYISDSVSEVLNHKDIIEFRSRRGENNDQNLSTSTETILFKTSRIKNPDQWDMEEDYTTGTWNILRVV